MCQKKFYIIQGSQGCFIDPPNYPTYKYYIEDISKTCSISLSKNMLNNPEYSYVDRDVKLKAEKLINVWFENRPCLSSPIVKDWIYQVLGYFSNCFQSIDGSWDADKLRCKHLKNKDKNFYYRYMVRTQLLNAGVHHIKKFYPEYKASMEDFRNAYWGKAKIFKG